MQTFGTSGTYSHGLLSYYGRRLFSYLPYLQQQCSSGGDGDWYSTFTCRMWSAYLHTITFVMPGYWIQSIPSNAQTQSSNDASGSTNTWTLQTMWTRIISFRVEYGRMYYKRFTAIYYKAWKRTTRPDDTHILGNMWFVSLLQRLEQ